MRALKTPVTIILAMIVVALLVGGNREAEAARWCAWYDPYTYDCGYYNFQQCLDTVSGAGGSCWRNLAPEAAPIAPGLHRHAHRRSRHRY